MDCLRKLAVSKIQVSDIFQENPTACDICDWINPIPPMRAGFRLRCARCGDIVYTHYSRLALQLWLNSLCAVLMFVLSFCFNFLGFEAKGTSRVITLADCIINLSLENFQLLGIIMTLALVVFPLLYLCSVMVLLLTISRQSTLSARLYGLVHLLERLKPWLMVDVFLLGGLVALIKLQSLAKIELGYSFWAFCCFTILLIRVAQLVDKRWFWNQLRGKGIEVAHTTGTAMAKGMKGCTRCGSLVLSSDKICPRCRHVVHSRRRNSLSKTCALLIAACVLYIPANVYPIMVTSFLGQQEPATIVGGIILLWSMHSYPIALIILIASVIVPLAKILSLCWLCWQAAFNTDVSTERKQVVYHVTEFVGKWSMVDVFVVAILAALVQLGTLMNIIPGQAALSFSFVVILTMLAAFNFDPRLIWDTQENSDAPAER
jgi:paraquat-inducible protein A